MKAYYDPVLSKEDPLHLIQLRIPESVYLILKREAEHEQRYPGEIVRKIVLDWERSTRAEREERMEAARAVGKRKRA